MTRQIYASGYRSASSAEAALIDFYAIGELSEGAEKPLIERREGGHFDRTRRYRLYVITILT